MSAEERNLLWLVFTDPYVRELLPDWETDSRHFLAVQSRGRTQAWRPFVLPARRPAARQQREFRAWWHTHDIEPFTSRERWLDHPEVGALRLEHHRLAPSDCPDLHVVIYTPVDLDTTQRLRVLLPARTRLPHGSMARMPPGVGRDTVASGWTVRSANSYDALLNSAAAVAP